MPLQFPATAALVLDLANHLTRTRRVARHRRRTGRFNSSPYWETSSIGFDGWRSVRAEFGSSAADLRQVVAEGMPLVVGLCDALGWIGVERAVGS